MLLDVVNLNCKYKNATKNCLNDINLDLSPGEIKVIVGPSGAGKSTLANFIAGLYPNDNCEIVSGNITYNNESIVNKPTYQKVMSVSMFFQNSNNQFCMKTLRDELKFILGNLLYLASDIDIKINEIMHALPIFPFLDRDFNTLSEGEKQIATLASILIIKPRILILDEPFAHLDDEYADQILVYLHRLTRQDNIAILAVDHLIERWLDVSNEIYLLSKDGIIIDNHITKINYQDKERLLIDNNIFVPYSHPIRKYHEKNLDIILSLQDFSLIKKNSSDILLHNVTYNFPKGNIIAILGKSGVGKTTFLDAIDANRNYEGTVYFENKELKKYKRKALANKIHMVLQNGEDVFIKDRVIDEVVDVLRLTNKKASFEELATTAIAELKKCGIYGEARKSPNELSLGQKRRLIIRLALLLSTDLLLIDEPTYGQDNNSTKEIMQDLISLKDQNTTIIFTTHNIDVAREYGDILLKFENRKMEEIR